jgi:hypothetical protein
MQPGPPGDVMIPTMQQNNGFEPYVPPDITARDKQFLRTYQLDSKKQVEFFARQPQLLLLFMVLSLGTYALYWFWRNWDAVRKANGQKLWPLPRSIFAVFYAWPLFKIMVLQARQRGFERPYYGGQLALAYVLPGLTLALSPYGQEYGNAFVVAQIAIAVINTVVLGLAQQAARYGMRISPHEELGYHPFTRWEIVFVIVFCVAPVLLSALV